MVGVDIFFSSFLSPFSHSMELMGLLATMGQSATIPVHTNRCNHDMDFFFLKKIIMLFSLFKRNFFKKKKTFNFLIIFFLMRACIHHLTHLFQRSKRDLRERQRFPTPFFACPIMFPVDADPAPDVDDQRPLSKRKTRRQGMSAKKIPVDLLRGPLELRTTTSLRDPLTRYLHQLWGAACQGH